MTKPVSGEVTIRYACLAEHSFRIDLFINIGLLSVSR